MVKRKSKAKRDVSESEGGDSVDKEELQKVLAKADQVVEHLQNGDVDQKQAVAEILDVIKELSTALKKEVK